MLSGRSSPSFVVAAAVLAVAVLGYGAWRYLRPSPYAASEEIVREFVGTVSREVRDFRRDVRSLASDAKSDGQAAEATAAAIDALADKARGAIDEHFDAAVDELLDLDIRLRTQRNRRGRLQARAEEAKEMITDLAEEAKQRLERGS